VASEETLTSETEPGETLTSTAEPESPVETQTSTEASPQPDLSKRLERLEANLAGTTKEWKRVQAEKDQIAAEKQRVEAENIQYRQWFQQQQMAQSAITQTTSGPSYDDLSKQKYEATIEGNTSRITEIERQQREIIRREEAAARNQEMQQLAQMAYQQQAMQRYMGEAGTSSQAKIEAEARKIATDPAYTAVHGNDPRLITIMATERVRAELAAGKAGAKEQAREESTNGAYTEGTKGSPPGKAPVAKDKMVFTSEDMRMITYDMKRHGMSEVEAKKKYWNAMRPEQREARLKK